MNRTIEQSRANCVHALTQYDITQSTKRGYNRYALAQYFSALDSVVGEVEDGRLPFDAVNDYFCDRVRDIVWKAWNL